MLNKKVIIRTYSSGVHFGELAEYTPENGTAKIKNSRRLWYWRVKDKKGISLSEVALYGLDGGSKVCSVVPEHHVAEVIEIIPCSDEAAYDILKKEVYTP